MSTHKDISIGLEPDCFYHLYNRGNNKGAIFYNPNNYLFFLKRFYKYMGDYLDVYAYCLLPNHFHFLVRIKSVDQLEVAITTHFPKQQEKETNSWYVSERLRRFFLSYSKAINLQENRTGSLFQKPFRRKSVESEAYLTEIIWYIHNNPVHHTLCSDLTHYPYSSYQRILLPKQSALKKAEVLDWFGGKDAFVKFHLRNS